MQKRIIIVTIVVLTIIIISRIPFLNSGFGRDPDSWRMAYTSRLFKTTGEYEISRPPGFPIPELAYSIAPSIDPLYLNLMTLFVGTAGVYVFLLILRTLKSKNTLWAVMAFAFTPVITINSTNTIDYLWALTFILWGFHNLLRRRYVLAGLFIGIAAGCRITSAFMILPFLVYTWSTDKKLDLKHTARFLGAIFLASVISYSPVFYFHGLKTFHTAGTAYPSALQILGRASFKVWGAIGSAAILASLFYHFVSTGTFKFTFDDKARPLVYSSIVVLTIYFITFLIFPYEGDYLIPIIPFTIILLDSVLRHRVFKITAIALMVSPFLLTIELSGIRAAGPLLTDHAYRLRDTRTANLVIAQSNRFEKKSVIVSGPYYPIIRFLQSDVPANKTEFVYLVNREQLHDYIESGFDIYYLPNLREYNLDVHGIDLDEYGAKEIRL